MTDARSPWDSWRAYRFWSGRSTSENIAPDAEAALRDLERRAEESVIVMIRRRVAMLAAARRG